MTTKTEIKKSAKSAVKKSTKIDLAKIAITEIISYQGTKTIPEILKTLKTDFGFKTTRDTVSKSLAELIDEKIIIQSQDKNKAGSFNFSIPKIIKKRGWKTDLIKKLVSQGGKISRANLAQIIQSDTRNTHILISCIRKSWETKFVIGWEKETKSYNFS